MAVFVHYESGLDGNDILVLLKFWMMEIKGL